MNRNKGTKTILGLMICVALAGCSEVKQESAETIWYVSKSASDVSDGLSWESAYAHPQDALDAAQPGDRVWVAQGSYLLRESGDEVLLRLKEGVAVLGGFKGSEIWEIQRNPQMLLTVLDGASIALHVVVGADGARLDGFTITGGNANGSGEDGAGGGMFNISSSPIIERCVFIDNSAALMGGGIYNEQGSPTLIDCVFRDNSAPYGGALENYSASPTVINTVFVENSSTQNGGAVSNYFSSPEFVNCAFSGNRTTFSGGAVFNYSGIQTFLNCTFTGNRSEQKGGGIGNLNSELRLTNCILWNNSSLEQSEISAYGTSTRVNYSNVEGGYQGFGNDGSSPEFVKDGRWNGDNWEEGDYRLTERSPCVDSGTDEGAPDFDIEWNLRPQALAHDKGAYEYRP
jgi:hypothetical protein